MSTSSKSNLQHVWLPKLGLKTDVNAWVPVIDRLAQKSMFGLPEINILIVRMPDGTLQEVDHWVELSVPN